MWANDDNLNATYHWESEHESCRVPEISEDFAIFDAEVGRRL